MLKAEVGVSIVLRQKLPSHKTPQGGRSTYLCDWWNGELQAQRWHILSEVQVLLLLSGGRLCVCWSAVLGDESVHFG